MTQSRSLENLILDLSELIDLGVVDGSKITAALEQLSVKALAMQLQTERLRTLCGDAADEYLRHWNNGADMSDAVYGRLRAASKGDAQAADPIPS